MLRIPSELENFDQWVLWKYETRDGKPTKIPYTVEGKRASSTNPKTWTDCDTARAVSVDYDGIGFVFNRADPFIGIDWDKIDLCDIIDEIKSFNSYAELSPSGFGAHCICKGVIPPGSRCRAGNREIYTHGRFFTFTGNHIKETPATVNDAPKTVIDSFLQRLGSTNMNEPHGTKKSATSPILPFKQHVVTKEELKKVYNACKIGRHYKQFEKLFGGDMGGYHSHSEADYALCYIIARHTNNPAIVDIIFRSSKLFRTKWNNNYYRTRTLNMAMTNALTAAIEDMINDS